MTDILERRLNVLSERLDVDVGRRLVDDVLSRLDPSPTRRRVPVRLAVRRRLQVAVASAAIVIATVLAIPGSRSAVARFFGIGSTKIERAPDTSAGPATTSPATAGAPSTTDAPPATFPTELSLGVPVSASEAASATGLPVPIAPSLGQPSGVFVTGAGEPEQVIVVYAPSALLPVSPVAGVGALLSSTRGQIDAGFYLKVVPPPTLVVEVQVTTASGAVVRGVWLEGEPHTYAFDETGHGDIREGTLRLATNTLLWQLGDFAYRLEAHISQAQALAIAADVTVSG